MRAILFLFVFAMLAPFGAHATDGDPGQTTWTPPAYGATPTKNVASKSPFEEGFAAKKMGPGARALTAAAVMALQTTNFAHIDEVDSTGVFARTPSGNPGRAGDRSFIGDKSMDNGIR
ncbi:MAG: hypothetical protein WBW32_10020 [Luteibacter sp.]